MAKKFAAKAPVFGQPFQAALGRRAERGDQGRRFSLLCLSYPSYNHFNMVRRSPPRRVGLKREKTLIFRVSKEEFGLFSDEATRRQMEKAELFRYLINRYFKDK